MNQSDYQQESFDPSDQQGHHGAKDLVQWFLRRFWVLLVTVLGSGLLGLYVYSNTPQTYRSTATVEIKRVKQEASVVDGDDEQIKLGATSDMVSAAEKLKLPGLYVDLAKSELFANRADVLPKRFRLPWQKPVSPASSDINPEELGKAMTNWVEVNWREGTTLLDLHAIHTDPRAARDLLTGLLAEYEESLESKFSGSSDSAMNYIMESSSQIKERILEIEEAIRLYNRCRDLSNEIRATERMISELEKRYLPDWPALVEEKELFRILKDRFSDAFSQVLSLSVQEKAYWDGNAEPLAQLSADKLIDAQIQLVSTRLSVLARELEAEQEIYGNLIIKLKEGKVSKGFASKEFEVADPPSFPSSPFAPDKGRILTQYLLGGVALGSGLILLFGFLDPTVRTVGELEALSSIPVIAAMPKPEKASVRENALVLIHDPQSQPAEAIRTLRAGLTFLGDTEERCSFLITSAVPGEGKSWIASNLALSFATQGDRTVIIDADLRRPVQQQIFSYERKDVGLSDILALGTPLADVMVESSVSKNLFIIPAGSQSANPSELLAGKNLPKLIEKLSAEFDRIIIDSAPLIPVSDSLPITKLVQSSVLVCQMGKTPRGAIKRAIRTLQQNGSEPVGLIANGLPKTRTKGSYGYYYSYQGGGNYAEYTSSR